MSSKLQSDIRCGGVPSGECLRGKGLVWLIGRLLAAAAGPIVR